MISLFWLVSLGLVVTAGAGTVVAYEVCRRYVLGKDAGLWAIATKALRQSWRQATVIGLLAVPVAAVGILTLSYLPTLGLAEVWVPLIVVGFSSCSWSSGASPSQPASPTPPGARCATGSRWG